MLALSGFLSAHLVGQINGLLKRARRYGFTLDVISVEDIAESVSYTHLTLPTILRV